MAGVKEKSSSLREREKKRKTKRWKVYCQERFRGEIRDLEILIDTMQSNAVTFIEIVSRVMCTYYLNSLFTVENSKRYFYRSNNTDRGNNNLIILLYHFSIIVET